MMYAAGDGGERILAEKSTVAKCPFCDEKMISKCGDINIWHWAHKNSEKCDEWKGVETEWHLSWKSKFNKEYVEKYFERDDEKHIADVSVPTRKHNEFVIEFQSSPISLEEIKRREKFYKNMAWVFNIQDSYPRFYVEPQDDFSTFVWSHPQKHVLLTSKNTFLDYLPSYKSTNTLFFIREKYHPDITGKWAGWGIVIEKDDLLDFVCHEGFYKGVHDSRNKFIKILFQVANNKKLPGWATKYRSSFLQQFQEVGDLSNKQVNILNSFVWK